MLMIVGWNLIWK